VAQALLTGLAIGFLGLITTAILGLAGADVTRHISYGFFSTLVLLLSHSMMMFYFIGKGKAVKDALQENAMTGDYYARIAAARKPVFSVATYAMIATIIAALLGASADTKVLPPIVHAMVAYGAIAFNLAAVRVEIDALRASNRVVDEVNRAIGAALPLPSRSSRSPASPRITARSARSASSICRLPRPRRWRFWGSTRAPRKSSSTW